MKSDLHKVLHPIAGQPMLLHLLSSFDELNPVHKVIVAGDRKEQLEAALAGTDTVIVVQEPQLGTAHAALQARDALKGYDGIIVICFGDGPLLRAETVARLCAELTGPDKPTVAVIGFRPDDPSAYGRIIADGGGNIAKMVEYKDATDAERTVTLCNSGVTAARADDLWRLLDRVGNNNAAQEYYLPDVVMLAIAEGGSARVIETSADEVIGINSRAELAVVEAIWQNQRRRAAMDGGATLIAPETVWFSHDTQLGRDVTVAPNVIFGPGTVIADNVVIHSFSHLHGAAVESGAEIGPYARLRPGAIIGERAKIGNFVEVKKARFGAGAKANHLSYVGDTIIGAGANIGAGTITCNYDGFFKYQTVIGAGAFIGSNTALVAPVIIGDGAIVAAGSVITCDVSADALALTRAAQTEKPGWAKRFRDAMSARKRGTKL